MPGDGCGDVVGVAVAERFDCFEGDVAAGERSGLVEADDVDPGQGLDGRQLLDQRSTTAEPDDADREGDAGQQHQSFGDHGHDAGDRARHGLAVARSESWWSWLNSRSAAVGTIA